MVCASSQKDHELLTLRMSSCHADAEPTLAKNV